MKHKTTAIIQLMLANEMQQVDYMRHLQRARHSHWH